MSDENDEYDDLLASMVQNQPDDMSDDDCLISSEPVVEERRNKRMRSETDSEVGIKRVKQEKVDSNGYHGEVATGEASVAIGEASVISEPENNDETRANDESHVTDDLLDGIGDDDVNGPYELRDYSSLRSLGLPLTVDDFLANVFEWSPPGLGIDADETEAEPKLRSIISRNSYEELESYKAAYVPLMLLNLWNELKVMHDFSKKDRSYINFSILYKFKDEKSNKAEIKCISMRPRDKPQQLKFGQLVIVRTAQQVDTITGPQVVQTGLSYFGYITQYRGRKHDAMNQCEVNHLKMLGKASEFVVDEIHILMKPVHEIINRDDSILVIEILGPIHHIILQSKCVYKLQQYASHCQILQPMYVIRPSGNPVEDIDEASFNQPKQFDAIQKSLDLFSSPTTKESSQFLCVSSANHEDLMKTLVEVVKQVIKCKNIETKKILLTSGVQSNLIVYYNILKQIYDNVFYVNHETNKDIIVKKASEISAHMVGNLKKKLGAALTAKDHKEVEKLQKNMRTYEECFLFFDADIARGSLSLSALIETNSIIERATRAILSTAVVIIGSITDLSNDLMFYLEHTKAGGSKLIGCIVDEASQVNEPELLSLMSFGIDKFVLSGHESAMPSCNNERVKKFHVNKSLFHRMVGGIVDEADLKTSVIKLN